MTEVDFSKIRVLIADEQHSVRTQLSQILHNLGVKAEYVFHAADGVTAIRVLDGRKVNVVLCDVALKPMDGMELLKAVRCGMTMALSSLPFIFLSPLPKRNKIALASQLDAAGFIIKPPVPVEVEKVLKLALAKPYPVVYPFYYHGIVLNSEYAYKHNEQHTAQAAEATLPAGSLYTKIKHLHPGALLACELRSKEGFLLLPQGVSLSEHQIRILQDARERYGITHVYILPESDFADKSL